MCNLVYAGWRRLTRRATRVVFAASIARVCAMRAGRCADHEHYIFADDHNRRCENSRREHHAGAYHFDGDGAEDDNKGCTG